MNMEINPTLMFVMQGLLAVIMAGFVFVLNGMRISMKEVRDDLKTLNDAVLGRYMTREASEAKWKEQRETDADIRLSVQTLRIDFERAKTGLL